MCVVCVVCVWCRRKLTNMYIVTEMGIQRMVARISTLPTMFSLSSCTTETMGQVEVVTRTVGYLEKIWSVSMTTSCQTWER